MRFEATLSELKNTGNLRRIPLSLGDGMVDFTSNDYLGFGSDELLREEFFSRHSGASLAMTSSASRLLAASQDSYSSLEQCLEDSYGRPALLFNSGYHANTGIIAAIASSSSLILADRLVHASIIDGMKLSGASFRRFPHNDFDKLESLLEDNYKKHDSVIVIVESIYSMDGDRADLGRVADLKKRFPDIILYVDEAHAVGVSGEAGLGETVRQGTFQSVDIIVGTFGKALASFGAFAVVSKPVRDYLINKSRALIFSTALPPIQVAWSEFVWRHMLSADSARANLERNSNLMAEIIPGGEPSHIRPWIIGDAVKAVEISGILAKNGFNVLPIRTPTVPPGTERLRFSLSAAINPEEFVRLRQAINTINRQK